MRPTFPVLYRSSSLLGVAIVLILSAALPAGAIDYEKFLICCDMLAQIGDRHQSENSLLAEFHRLMQPRERPYLIDRGPVVRVQLQPQLKAKPRYIIGRVIDNQGRPVLPIEIHVQGFPTGSPIAYYGNFEPPINPQTGYYEIRIEDGAYRVSVRFNKEFRDRMPATVECLQILEDFVAADGTRYAEQPFNESKMGIVRDFIWNPDAQFLQRCRSLFHR